MQDANFHFPRNLKIARLKTDHGLTKIENSSTYSRVSQGWWEILGLRQLKKDPFALYTERHVVYIAPHTQTRSIT
jgi:hypothetical protein